jgi:hypothetical protein
MTALGGIFLWLVTIKQETPVPLSFVELGLMLIDLPPLPIVALVGLLDGLPG